MAASDPLQCHCGEKKKRSAAKVSPLSRPTDMEGEPLEGTYRGPIKLGAGLQRDLSYLSFQKLNKQFEKNSLF